MAANEALAYIDGVLADSATPAQLVPLYENFRALYDKKLWYQLALAIEEFLRHPASQQNARQIALYEHFIRTFAKHINHLKLASFGVIVSRQFDDAAKAYAFLHALADAWRDDAEKQDAYTLLAMEGAHFQLLLGNVAETKEAMEECAKILDKVSSVDPLVNASFYRVSGNYYKSKAEYADYYRNFLLFLACINVDAEMSVAEQVQSAHDLGISALLGDTIYNFGELLLHPIFQSLRGTGYEWISELLYAFNAGDIGRFEAVIPKLAQEPILESNLAFLRQKICLMALIENVFRRSPDDRTLSFDTVARETHIPVDEVEHLIMKALSLHLIRGSLDEAAHFVHITWVQPRVLDKDQMKALAERLSTWCEHVEHVSQFVMSQSPELFSSA
ncbi:26S proteasome regulatory subunit [Malassezia vespertilionis]|uniref:Rpn9p n=1 Tax=Malassezia vespertilionis TaxID=2020962 RepID=A0A2N1J9M6_9BASI|nr:26S proteasome regulatory subunit [Malassezia vespertilionis]PKI83259.1 Rpn9p [Malassezia vespertilionis]WFD07842.1 26S proteasome regulatory subunit [Malassezia vespertilionis]